MKIYLAIKYHHDLSNKKLIVELSDHLKSRGHEVVNVHQDLEQWGEINFTPSDLMKGAFRLIDESDLTLIEFSEKGVGIGIDAFEKGFFADLGQAQTDYGFRTVIERASGNHVGDCGLIQKEIESKAEIEIVYFFNFSYWGRGFATEAARAMVDFGINELSLGRLVALIHPENEASKKVAEKLGLGFEKNVVTESGNKRFLYSKEK